jgi:hypothetical protein
MLGRRLLQIAVVFIVLILAVVLPMFLNNRSVKNDSTSAPYLAAAKTEAQPLLDALEKYRAEHALYPATLDQITPQYLPAGWGVDRYRYTARRPDWTLKSDACAAREKSLHGWVMKPADQYAKEVAQFKLDCISGYRDFQLQSPDFPSSAQSPNSERWAWYDSFTKQWSLGWCHHDLTTKGKQQDSAMNGVCRQRQDRQTVDPW